MLNTYNLIKDYKKISIIGMEKNVGKTTLLNKLIEDISDKKVIGLTSIGRDGEDTDVVTNTHKPRIYVYPKTIIATAKNCLRNCDITKEILYSTDFSTPMGDIIVIRALSAGYVDIAGPSYNAQTKVILKIMESFGSELSIVDGALGRKGTAIEDVTDATILATGAALSLDMNKVVDETKKTVTLLDLPEVEKKYKEILNEMISENRVGILKHSGETLMLNATNSLTSNDEVKSFLNEDVHMIVVKGAITSTFIDILIKNREDFKKLTLVALDGTRFFLDYTMLTKAKACGIELKVLNKINLLFVTCNPLSPLGYEFPKEKFKKLIAESIDFPVIDVVGDE